MSTAALRAELYKSNDINFLGVLHKTLASVHYGVKWDLFKHVILLYVLALYLIGIQLFSLGIL